MAWNLESKFCDEPLEMAENEKNKTLDQKN